VIPSSPVLINLHGSGFVIPFHGSDDLFCRTISHGAGCTILDVRYSLAPEHPFPAALHDVEDVVNWVLGQKDEYDPKVLSISGFSASGNLAFVAASHLFPKDTFRSCIAFYPVTDLATDPALKKVPDMPGRTLPALVGRLCN
jgi:acetyl esterase/lipase